LLVLREMAGNGSHVAPSGRLPARGRPSRDADRARRRAQVRWQLLHILARFGEDESGVELLEWVMVTVILTLAAYALLQTVGPDIETFVVGLIERMGL